MAVRYELFLRRAAALSDADLADIAARANAVDSRLVVDVYRDDARALGVDLGLDVQRAAGAEKLSAVAFDVAAALEMSIFDPQLGRTVAPADEDAIARRFDAATAFTLAVPVTPSAGPTPRWSSTTKMWLVVAGALGLVVFSGRLLQCAL